MSQNEWAAFVAGVITEAERLFGPDLDPALLAAYAREVTLDLWLTRPGVTVFVAEQVRRQVCREYERRTHARLPQSQTC